jgi:ATP-binding cassette subfamily B protein/subfamily B ATP-binding cassette protein MsbA
MRHGLQRVASIDEEKAKDQGQVIGRLLKLLGNERWLVIGGLILVVISAASRGLAPILIGQAIDQFISEGQAQGLGRLIILIALVYVINAVTTRYRISMMAQAGQKVLARLRNLVFEKIHSLSLQYLESSQAGDLISRLINDIDALNSFFAESFSQMIGQIFSLIGITVGMLILNWQLGLAVLVMVPVLIWVTRTFSRWARQAFRQTRETIGDVSAELEEELGGVKVAQAFNRTERNVQRFAQRNAANRDANINANAITSAFSPTMDLLSTLDLAIVAGMGGVMAIRGVISVGTVVAFLQYVQNFFRPIQAVSQLWTVAQSAFAAAERIFGLIDREPLITDSPDAVVMPSIDGLVVFEDVRFAYEGDETVLEGISFEVAPGQTLAVVGPTGAGKTTLVSLIPRFYDVKSGMVEIDGHDVRAVTQESLRRQMGIVTQDPFLFSGPVMENIRYGRLDASDDAVREAARAANADDFIQRLPHGYATDIGERGKLLSQGQRQLIAFARAILANPRILILDEATSSIDTHTEVLIQQALEKLLKGRTSFVIAHRLSTVRNADRILVLDQGRIVERGDHCALIAQDGLYAELYQKQFYTPDDEDDPAADPLSGC